MEEMKIDGLECEDVESMLIDMINDKIEEMELDTDIEVSSFNEASLLTLDKGVVVRFPDGREFDITIVRAR